MLKKILKYSGISLLVLLVLAFTLPFLFKGKIIALVKTEVNNKLNATVDFEDIDISLFRNFPKLSVGLNNLYIVGKDAFVNDTLLKAQQIDVALNLISAIKGKNIKIYSIEVETPIVHALVNK
ncbi:MAG: AsmA family protein, partial [Chitinophagaceae bacterium]|nr:AsmA family protein [Chitinophagaceae bacterium]